MPIVKIEWKVIKNASVSGGWIRRMDWILMGAVLSLIFMGFVSIASAVTPMLNGSRFLIKQGVAVVVGLGLFFVVSSLNYQIFRNYSSYLYTLITFLLILVLLIGKKIKGAASWFVMGPISFEPVELAAIGFIIVLAALLDRPEKEVSSWRLLFGAFLLAGIHIVLILVEPHLGGTLVYMPVTLGMLYFGGVNPLYLLGIVFYVAVAVGIPILSTFFSIQPHLLATHPILKFIVQSTQGGRHTIEFIAVVGALIFLLWWFIWKLQIRISWHYALFLLGIVAIGTCTAYLAEHIVKDYQRKRILVFLSPGFDPLGAGYHISQSQIAVGSGRFLGRGFASGPQTQLGFLPEQHTDFIFAVIGEEMGFIWASFVLVAFGVIVWRSIVIATETPDRFGAMIAAGLSCMFAFECFVNVGMVLGILPVTGLVLPFVSYGGSHMVSSLIAIGLLQSVNFRRYIYL